MFSNVGPTLWMTLPKKHQGLLIIFKRLLNTHFLKLAYDMYTQLLYNAINIPVCFISLQIPFYAFKCTAL